MDDLSATINQFLANPDNVRQLQDAAASLGLSGQSSPSSAPGPSGNANDGWGSSGWTTGSSGRNTKRGQSMPSLPAPSRQTAPKRDDDLVAIRSMLEQLLHEQKAARPDLPPPPPPLAPASPDLSGLSGLLGNLGGASKSPSGSGLNLSALSDILGNRNAPAPSQSPDLSSLLSTLGGSAPSAQPAGGSGLDLSGLASLLGGSGSGGSGIDLSSLSGLLGNLGSKSAEPAASPSSVSTLTSMLGGNNQPAPGGLGSGINLGMISRFQEAMSSMNTSAGNVSLLLALKGHLRDEDRIAKVDDAIRVMQVVQFLPLLKESGLFGKLEEILDGFNLGGIGDMLGGLTGRR